MKKKKKKNIKYIIQEHQFELNKLKEENEELRALKETTEKNCNLAMNDNNALQIKLENLGSFCFLSVFK